MLSKASWIACLSFLISGSCLALTCDVTSIQWIENAQTKQKKENLCFNLDKHTFASKSCDLQPFKCGIMRKATPWIGKIDTSEAGGEIGSPGFLACHKIGGSPQVVETQIHGEKLKFSRCIDLEDQSFIDTKSLLNFIHGG